MFESKETLERWLAALEEVVKQYPGRTIDNIIENIKARIDARK